MPYEAAKAIAATFCWKMRYALTPVFGLDFPDTCLPPDDPHYGDMILDHEITKRCTEEAAEYRAMELESRGTSARASPMLSSPMTPSTPTHPRLYKELRPKTLKLDTTPSAYIPESYIRDDKYQLSSKSDHYRNMWTPVTPRSDDFGARLPAVRDIVAGTKTSTKRGASHMSGSSSDLSSPEISPRTPIKRAHHADEDYDGDSSTTDEEVNGKDGLAGAKVMDGKVMERDRLPSDEKAAYLLMTLSMHRAPGETVEDQVRDLKKRRATE